jgi:hypothetical protein
MAYWDAILQSELISYVTATILITIAVWIFSSLYSCVTCAPKEQKDAASTSMTSEKWFKVLLGTACAACSVLLLYRNLASPSAKSTPLADARSPPVVRTGGLAFDSDSEESDNFN